MNIPVVDKEIIQQPKIVKAIDLYIVNLNLNQNVSVKVNYYDSLDIANTNPFDTAYITIEGPEYEAWGSDDTYLENLVLQKLGLQRA